MAADVLACERRLIGLHLRSGGSQASGRQLPDVPLHTSGACQDTRWSSRPCATPTSTPSVSPDSMSLCMLNPIEPPWYGPVCPVVWEGRHREVSPYPDQSYIFISIESVHTA